MKRHVDFGKRFLPKIQRRFLDYYYRIKTAENEIFVIEEAQTIRSMLQLNPYRLRVNKACFSANYIIAVATDEKYRKRG